MTDDDITGIFLFSLTLLDVDDNGLTDDNDIHDLEAIAKLCRDVKAITAAADTPYQMALFRLAVLTEDVLVTWVIPDRQVVKAWVLARAEVLKLRLAGNC